MQPLYFFHSSIYPNHKPTMSSIFSKIVKGEIPSYKIAETDDFYAFLDIYPIAKGHTLVIPKMEVDYIFDLPDDIYLGLHVFAKEIARAMKAAIPCKRIGTSVIGLEVPHTHIHLVPINSIEDLTFTKPKLKFSPEDFQAITQSIQKEL